MNEKVTFALETAWRAFAVMGYSFFGLIVATQNIELCLQASLIAGGSYFFTEMVRHYNINFKRDNFKFLLFP